MKTSGTMPSAPGRVILKDPAQSSITIIPMLPTRKAMLCSSIHAANRTKLGSASYHTVLIRTSK